MVEAVRTDDPVGRRNYAMLLLMARLGLRSPEVIAIRLEDLDWRAGEILIRGKGRLHDRMPLPPDVGEAIVEYIRDGRHGESRVLFVSSKIPYRPFGDAQILNTVLRSAFEKTGLKPPQKYVGSHLLRHSLATDMLRNGASLDEIGDVLRHRSCIGLQEGNIALDLSAARVGFGFGEAAGIDDGRAALALAHVSAEFVCLAQRHPC